MRRPKRKAYNKDWIKVNDQYGYGMMADAMPNKLKQIDSDYLYVQYGSIPEWMGNGYVQNQILIEVPEGKTEFEYKYDVSTAFLPLLKPHAIPYAKEEEPITTTFQTPPTSDITLIGIDYSHKYVMLPFSFSLYDENNQLISICKNGFTVNGNIGEKAPLTLGPDIKLHNLRIQITPR